MRKRKRIQDGMKYGILYTIVLMILGAYYRNFPSAFATLFNADSQEGIFYWCDENYINQFYICGNQCSISGIYQALDGGMESLIISL